MQEISFLVLRVFKFSQIAKAAQDSLYTCAPGVIEQNSLRSLRSFVPSASLH